MSTTESMAAELSGEELGRLLKLMKGADTVELKLTVPTSEHRAAIKNLQLDALDAQIRQVYFFDTPDLTLNQAGVVARARRIQGKGGDSVVKLRPVVPDDIPEHLRQSPSVGVEVDAMPGGFVCSASVKGKNGINDAREVHFGDRPLRKLFTKEQRAFYARHAPDGSRARRPHRARADLRLETQVRARGVRPPGRCRDVALPRRQPDPRALDEVPSERRVPGRGRDTRVPRRAGHQSRGRTADEDEDRAGVLRQGALDREGRAHSSSAMNSFALIGCENIG